MTIDTTKLRELAQKATPGPWEQINHIVFTETGDLEWVVANARSGNSIIDAEYIAAANPATVLALLDKLDGTESMFLAACADLGAINKLLGLDPDDGGAEPILYEVKRLIAIESAARNLVKVKGRHHSEQAMNQLLEALK